MLYIFKRCTSLLWPWKMKFRYGYYSCIVIITNTNVFKYLKFQTWQCYYILPTAKLFQKTFWTITLIVHWNFRKWIHSLLRKQSYSDGFSFEINTCKMNMKQYHLILSLIWMHYRWNECIIIFPKISSLKRHTIVALCYSTILLIIIWSVLYDLIFNHLCKIYENFMNQIIIWCNMYKCRGLETSEVHSISLIASEAISNWATYGKAITFVKTEQRNKQDLCFHLHANWWDTSVRENSNRAKYFKKIYENIKKKEISLL